MIMRRYGRASTMLTSKRAVEDWGKLLGDAAAVNAMLDRLLHHGHVLVREAGELNWTCPNNRRLTEDGELSYRQGTCAKARGAQSEHMDEAIKRKAAQKTVRM
jgi:hypothetical protein